jgi:hypothetical protein
MSGRLWRYPKGLSVKPNTAHEPTAYQNWEDNDRTVLGLIRTHLESSERDFIKDATTSKQALDLLHDRHEKQGVLRQVSLIQKALDISYS